MIPTNAYDLWAPTYDSQENKTRDMELIAQQRLLNNKSYVRILEIGCGTGKNTQVLLNYAKHIDAVDNSKQMITNAKEKINSDRVNFIQADISTQWKFATSKYDLVSCSLILEHIADLGDVFAKMAEALEMNGEVYIGELHPYKQYGGTKANFDTPTGNIQIDCFIHHISDFINAAAINGLQCIEMLELFDEDKNVPRIFAALFQKK